MNQPPIHILLVEDSPIDPKNSPFNLVLLDLSLPDSSGLDTVTRFRHAVPDLPIIVLTMSDDDELALQALNQGAQDYLVKDQITIQMLVRTIRYAMERWQIMQQLNASLKQREVLLQEVHHRVKNSLQIVASLLRLQANGITDETTCQLFTECQNRVESIALIHEMLYQRSNLTDIDAAAYIQSLTTNVMRSQTASLATVRLTLDIAPVSLGMNMAIPCG